MAQGSHCPVLTQIRMHNDATEFEIDSLSHIIIVFIWIVISLLGIGFDSNTKK